MHIVQKAYRIAIVLALLTLVLVLSMLPARTQVPAIPPQPTPQTIQRAADGVPGIVDAPQSR